MLTSYDTVRRKTRGSDSQFRSLRRNAHSTSGRPHSGPAPNGSAFAGVPAGWRCHVRLAFQGAPKSEGTPPFPGGEPERESLPVAGSRHFLLSAASGRGVRTSGVRTSVQHEDWEVLFLFGSDLPRPRHDVRSQRLQGETAGSSARSAALPPGWSRARSARGSSAPAWGLV